MHTGWQEVLLDKLRDFRMTMYLTNLDIKTQLKICKLTEKIETHIKDQKNDR